MANNWKDKINNLSSFFPKDDSKKDKDNKLLNELPDAGKWDSTLKSEEALYSPEYAEKREEVYKRMPWLKDRVKTEYERQRDLKEYANSKIKDEKEDEDKLKDYIKAFEDSSDNFFNDEINNAINSSLGIGDTGYFGSTPNIIENNQKEANNYKDILDNNIPKEARRDDNLIESFADSFKRSWENMKTGFSRTIESYAPELGFNEKKVQQYTDNIKKKIIDNPDWGPPKDMQKWSVEHITRLAGGVAPSILGGLGAMAGGAIVGGAMGGPLGATIGGATSGFAYGYSMEGGLAYDEAKKFGATDEEASKTQNIVGVINGAIELMPEGRLIKSMGKEVGTSFLKNLTKETVKQGLWEATEETVQETVSNVALKTYDENKKWFDNLDTAFAGGFLGGGPFGAAGSIINSISDVNQFWHQIDDEMRSEYKATLPEKETTKLETIKETFSTEKLQPLAKEALNNNKILVRGESGVASVEGQPLEDLYFTRDIDTAKQYTKNKTLEGVQYIDTSNLNIATDKDLKELDIKRYPPAGVEPEQYRQDFRKKMKENGFDGIDNSEENKKAGRDERSEIQIFEWAKDKIGQKPISQLSKPTEPLAKETQKYDSAEEFIKNTKPKDIFPGSTINQEVYHGTLEDFNEFSIERAGENTEADNAKWGFFFLENQGRAENFVEETRTEGDQRSIKMKKSYLNIKNPLDLTYQDLFNKEKQAGDVYEMMTGKTLPNNEALEWINKNIGLGEIADFYDSVYSNLDNKQFLQDKGYDGIIDEFGRGKEGNIIKEYVAFSPEQIKTESQLKDTYNQVKQPGVGAESLRNNRERTIDNKIKPDKEISNPINETSPESWVDRNLEKLKKAKNKFLDTFDIETRYKRIGAPETGIAIKNYFSKQAALEEKTLNTVKELHKLNFERADFTELAFASEKESLIEDFDNPDKARKAVNIVRGFFEDMESEGEFPHFPDTMIDRMNNIISDNNALINSLNQQDTLTETEQQRLNSAEQQIAKAEDTINYLQNENIQYIHLPVKFWLDDILNKSKDINEYNRIISSIPYGILGRETPSLEILYKTLSEKGLIEKGDIDIRDIINNYGKYISKKVALSDIFRKAENEGLVKPEAELTEAQKEKWTRATYITPEFKGYKLHPALADIIEQYSSYSKSNIPINRVFGVIKMMQFYNPLFLPMYDVVQSAMAGVLTKPTKVPSHIKNAIKHIRAKDAHYYEALENGLTSKPYANPFDNYMKEAARMKKANDKTLMMRTLAQIPQMFKDPSSLFSAVTSPLKTLYTTSWNVAWTLDKWVRFVTYEHLLDKGLTSKDAAQMAARFHGDYASVPAKTRKFLNIPFFTPTFKVVMAKLFYNMANSSIKVIGGSRGKKDLGYALGLLMLGSIWFARDFFMKNIMGFKSDKIFKRYTKEIEVPQKGGEGTKKKELALTLSGPDLIFWRYYHRFKPQETDMWNLSPIERTFEKIKWDLHPIWQWGFEMVNNKGTDFENITSDFAPPGKQAKDYTLYTINRFIGVSKLIAEQGGPNEKEAFNALKDTVGPVTAYLLKPFTFTYLRNTKDKRKAYLMNNLVEEFRSDFYEDMPTNKDGSINQKELDARIKKLLDMIDRVKRKEEKSDFPDGYKPEEIDFKSIDWSNVEL